MTKKAPCPVCKKETEIVRAGMYYMCLSCGVIFEPKTIIQ